MSVLVSWKRRRVYQGGYDNGVSGAGCSISTSWIYALHESEPVTHSDLRINSSTIESR